VYLCSIAHAQGTTKVQTTTQLSGTTVGTVYGAQGVNAAMLQHGGTQTTHSTLQTEFAKRAAPPTNWFTVWSAQAVISAITVVAVYFLHSLAAFLGVFELLAVPWLLVSLVGTVLTYPKREGYARAAFDWQRTWICTRCGTKFIPSNVTVTV
jgi:hypothetical protein